MAYTQTIKFSNNASANVATSLLVAGTSVTVGDGSIFPVAGGANYFYATITDGTNLEIVKCTSRSGNVLTISRGKDGTTAKNFINGYTISVRLPNLAIEDLQTALSGYSDTALTSALNGGLYTPVFNGLSSTGTIYTNTISTTGPFLLLEASTTVGLLELRGKAVSITASNTLLINSTSTGTIDNCSIGATTPATGTFTGLTVQGSATLGDSSSDSLTIATNYIAYNSTNKTFGEATTYSTFAGYLITNKGLTVGTDSSAYFTCTGTAWTMANGFAINTDHFVLSSTGYIGIGKAVSATYLVDVDGKLNATELYLNGVPVTTGASKWTDSTADIYRNSKVRIGSAVAPTDTLDVTGTFAVSGNATVGGAAVTWSGNPTHSGNHTFSGDVTTQGNTSIGNAAGDTLTIASNAVTWSNDPTHSGAHTFSGVVKVSNGAVGAPAIAFTNSATTGFYRVGADHLGIATAGTSRIEVDNAGLVGIGMTPATYKVNVNGTINATEVRVGGVVLTPGTGSNWNTTGADVYRGAGAVYINSATNTSGYTLYVNGSIGTTSDLTVGGSAKRIFGDFSNATRANRVLFKSSTTNDATNVGIIPNGSSRIAALTAFNAVDPDNSGFIQMYISDTVARLDSIKSGTGAALPLDIYVESTFNTRFTSSGEVLIGTTSDSGDHKLQVSGNAYISGSVARTVVTKTADYTITAGDHYVLVNASGGDVVITLPLSNFLTTDNLGLEYKIKRKDNSANLVKIKNTGADTTDSVNLDGTTNYISLSANESVTLVADGITSWFTF